VFVLFELEEMSGQDIAQSARHLGRHGALALRLAVKRSRARSNGSRLAQGNGRKEPYDRRSERLLSISSGSDPLERELLGSVRHVGPPDGAKAQAWRNIAGQIAVVAAVGARQ